MLPTQGESQPRTRRRLGTVNELRDTLLPLPKTTLHEMARQGRLPGVVKVGRRTLFDLDTIEEWINNGGHRLRGSNP